MTILALETTAKAASCAVLREGAPLATAWQATGLTHSRTLMPIVEDMLKNSELTLADMDAIAVAAGPGATFRPPRPRSSHPGSRNTGREAAKTSTDPSAWVLSRAVCVIPCWFIALT